MFFVYCCVLLCSVVYCCVLLCFIVYCCVLLCIVVNCCILCPLLLVERSKIGTLDPYLTPLNTSESYEICWGIHLASVGEAQGVTDP